MKRFIAPLLACLMVVTAGTPASSKSEIPPASMGATTFITITPAEQEMIRRNSITLRCIRREMTNSNYRYDFWVASQGRPLARRLGAYAWTQSEWAAASKRVGKPGWMSPVAASPAHQDLIAAYTLERAAGDPYTQWPHSAISCIYVG